jgi:hypothetical protein
MDYKTSKFSLTEIEQNLRTGLVELIRSHVEERGISRESLNKVLDSLEFVLDDSRFEQKELFSDDLQSTEIVFVRGIVKSSKVS